MSYERLFRVPSDYPYRNRSSIAKLTVSIDELRSSMTRRTGRSDDTYRTPVLHRRD